LLEKKTEGKGTSEKEQEKTLTPYYDQNRITIYQGDVLEVLEQLPAESVDTIVSSPPYYALRVYDGAEKQWPDGWYGQLGLEPTPELYIEHMRLIFRALKRVLKPTGTLWWNIGDTYAGDKKGKTDKKVADYVKESQKGLIKQSPENLPAKCLMMIPERTAFMAIEEGFTLRNKIIWHKKNAMPSSVKDRFTTVYEFVYMFAKNRKYYFDLDTVRVEPSFKEVWGRKGASPGTPYEQNNPRKRWEITKKETKIPQDQAENFGSPRARYYRKQDNIPGKNTNTYKGFNERWKNRGKAQEILKERGCQPTGIGPTGFDHNLLNNPKGKNPGDVWTIATQPFSESHFATFPPKLVEPIIKCGCPVNGIVLDPFAGAGTTGLVARKLNRQAILIEISKKYCDMMIRRFRQQHLDL